MRLGLWVAPQHVAHGLVGVVATYEVLMCFCGLWCIVMSDDGGGSLLVGLIMPVMGGVSRGPLVHWRCYSS